MAEETMTTPASEPQTEENRQPDSGKRLSPQRKAALLLVTLVLIGSWFGLRWLVHSRTNLETDNAFVEARVHPVASRVPGTVVAVQVRDNQLVKTGDLLVELDPADYRLATEKAEAAVGLAINETSSDTSQVSAARAAVQSAQARRDQAHQDLRRGEALHTREVIAKEQLERLQTGQRVAEAALREAQEQLKRAEAQAGLNAGPGAQARIRLRQAELAESRLRLSYTRITAPADGYITRKGVEPGATVQAGQPLMAVVPLQEPWIVANYKESQLTHIRPGQKVSFRVDAYPGRRFSGNVDSIMAGTGAAFSLLPPENATGNYVKVVQRIPVKILIDPDSDPEHLLRMGMSVVPVIHTGRGFGDVLRELSPLR